MTRDFWATFNQYDLFPNRETVGQEMVVLMVATMPPAAPEAVTEPS